jgi:hypothetical protein
LPGAPVLPDMPSPPPIVSTIHYSIISSTIATSFPCRPWQLCCGRDGRYKYEAFVKLLKEAKVRYPVKLYGYCLIISGKGFVHHHKIKSGRSGDWGSTCPTQRRHVLKWGSFGGSCLQEYDSTHGSFFHLFSSTAIIHEPDDLPRLRTNQCFFLHRFPSSTDPHCHDNLLRLCFFSPLHDSPLTPKIMG